MWPMAYAIVNTVSPNASDTPRSPIPRFELVPPKAAARTALPQPPNTSQNVPKNSAASFCCMPHPIRFRHAEYRSMTKASPKPSPHERTNVERQHGVTEQWIVDPEVGCDRAP